MSIGGPPWYRIPWNEWKWHFISITTILSLKDMVPTLFIHHWMSARSPAMCQIRTSVASNDWWTDGWLIWCIDDASGRENEVENRGRMIESSEEWLRPKPLNWIWARNCRKDRGFKCSLWALIYEMFQLIWWNSLSIIEQLFGLTLFILTIIFQIKYAD